MGNSVPGGGRVAQSDGDLGPSGNVQAALDAVVLQSVRFLSLWLAVLFPVFAPFDLWLTEPHAAAQVTAGLDVATGCAMLLIHLRARRASSSSQAHVLAAAMALAVLPYLAASIIFVARPVESAGLALWHVGASLVFLSWPWLVSLLVLSDVLWATLVVWGVASGRIEGSPDWAQYAFVLLTSTLIACVAHGVRLRTYRHLEALRQEERTRRVELERAQAAAREVEAVRRANELKTQFLNTAAHELSTPMTPILLETHMLRAAVARQGDLALARSWEILDRNLQRLGGLLRDVLDSARLESDRLPLRPQAMDLAAVADHAVAEYRSSAEAAGVSLSSQHPGAVSIQGDAQRLQQVVSNLVGNALKFTPAGGSVRVAVSVGPAPLPGPDRPDMAEGGAHEAEWARVEVRDTGSGLRAEDLPRLFQPFSQVHAVEATAPQGTGLGLYICRGIVERHGGRIGVESAGPGQGATFWFMVPVDGPPSK